MPGKWIPSCLNYGCLSVNRENLWASSWSRLKGKLVKTHLAHHKVWGYFWFKNRICIHPCLQYKSHYFFSSSQLWHWNWNQIVYAANSFVNLKILTALSRRHHSLICQRSVYFCSKLVKQRDRISWMRHLAECPRGVFLGEDEEIEGKNLFLLESKRWNGKAEGTVWGLTETWEGFPDPQNHRSRNRLATLTEVSAFYKALTDFYLLLRTILSKKKKKSKKS